MNPRDVLSRVLEELEDKNLTETQSLMKHPQNLMRNVAKSGCLSTYTYVPDIDMIPGSIFNYDPGSTAAQSLREQNTPIN